MTENLLPCPFCGGKAHYGTVRFSKNAVPIEEAGRVNHLVSCELCNATTQTLTGYRTQAEAAEKWNTRTAASPWIPVSEQLPIDYGVRQGIYEVTIEGRDRIFIENWDVTAQGQWGSFSSKGEWQPCRRKVVAWKPLPAPYSPDEGERNESRGTERPSVFNRETG